VAAATTESRLQRSVAAVLATVSPGFEEEVLEETTGYSLDLALRSSRVAIEVDGPSHFLRPSSRGDKHLPNGPTLLKRRLLKVAGWRLISVPFYEWGLLPGREEQRHYLAQRLDQTLKQSVASAKVAGEKAASAKVAELAAAEKAVKELTTAKKAAAEMAAAEKVATEEAVAEKAAAESVAPKPLAEQVRVAIVTYALEEGWLAAMFAANALPWDEEIGRNMVEMAVQQIGASVESRGKTSYALNGNALRIASVKKYLEKVVAIHAKKASQPGGYRLVLSRTE